MIISFYLIFTILNHLHHNTADSGVAVDSSCRPQLLPQHVGIERMVSTVHDLGNGWPQPAIAGGK
jgi:hypothetical protein